MGNFLIIVLLLVVVWFIVNINREYKSNDGIEESPSKGSNTKRTRKQTSNIWKLNLRGVYFNYGDRREAFKETKKGDSVTVKFEIGNPHDRNALGVYTMSGKLLGYIPRDSKRVIGVVRKNGNIQATVLEKVDEGYNKEIIVEFPMS